MVVVVNNVEGALGHIVSKVECRIWLSGLRVVPVEGYHLSIVFLRLPSPHHVCAYKTKPASLKTSHEYRTVYTRPSDNKRV